MYVISDCGECSNDGYSCYHQCARSVYCYNYDIPILCMLFQIMVNALMMAIPAIINVLVVCIVITMISLSYVCYFRLW